MTEHELVARAIRFEKPERIPIRLNINYSCWAAYGTERVREWVEGHPLLFPWGKGLDWKTFQPWCSPLARAGQPFIDAWGCVWETSQDGIMGAVTRHPLKTWDDFERWSPPDPSKTNGNTPLDWKAIRESVSRARAAKEFPEGGLVHGHTFLLLTYLRGYENLLLDMVDGEPRLDRLVEMVTAFNEGLVRRYLEAGVESMSCPEDLGMQKGPMIPPKLFLKYIQPAYRRIMQPARDAGCLIQVHSDGDLHELIEPLLECGVNSMNLQDVVNGVDWIAQRLKGRVCIDIDIDRQNVTRFGAPAEIERHIEGLVRRLGSPEGGLMMLYGLYPDLPHENVVAVMDSMERFSTFYS
jgi:hypothetical protein